MVTHRRSYFILLPFQDIPVDTSLSNWRKKSGCAHRIRAAHQGEVTACPSNGRYKARAFPRQSRQEGESAAEAARQIFKFYACDTSLCEGNHITERLRWFWTHGLTRVTRTTKLASWLLLARLCSALTAAIFLHRIQAAKNTSSATYVEPKTKVSRFIH